MPRPPRLEIPGLPHHVVQRGVDRQAVFFDDDCYHTYLQYLQQYSYRYCLRVHSWCLMTNHIHLLVTPNSEKGISKLMQSLNSGYAQLINQRFRRSGHLWSGRFKSSLIDSDHYLLTCMRYIELNPVRAGMVTRPEDYRWSSYRHNALDGWQPWITPHEMYTALGKNRRERRAHYREIVLSPLEEDQLGSLRQATEQGRVFGSDRFQAQISAMLGRDLSPRKRGRPRKEG
ncbi:REP-associated tyrosine transposase [Marinobacterium arenosum]|uniref:REP-associated tyrosine transposase n=1 Tax=Marinobacterium arenosum TaxID=2862496 RepID=UPI001C9889CC|nr:transposase [Marinobacterium arenosum]MBY4676814.1 transposase [Marinobacterium arenosum]